MNQLGAVFWRDPRDNASLAGADYYLLIWIGDKGREVLLEGIVSGGYRQTRHSIQEAFGRIWINAGAPPIARVQSPIAATDRASATLAMVGGTRRPLRARSRAHARGQKTESALRGSPPASATLRSAPFDDRCRAHVKRRFYMCEMTSRQGTDSKPISGKGHTTSAVETQGFNVPHSGFRGWIREPGRSRWVAPRRIVVNKETASLVSSNLTDILGGHWKEALMRGERLSTTSSLGGPTFHPRMMLSAAALAVGVCAVAIFMQTDTYREGIASQGRRLDRGLSRPIRARGDRQQLSLRRLHLWPPVAGREAHLESDARIVRPLPPRSPVRE